MGIKGIEGLVNVKDLDENIIIDLRYATKSNFTGRKIYPLDVCVLRKETAEKLINANKEFKKRGYIIKIWDAYRPIYVQQIFWDIVKDNRFIANPKNGGSRHNRGTAVDITLVDNRGNELVMPSQFDDFSINAYRYNPNASKEVSRNIKLLTEVMEANGFIALDEEWWHFDDCDYKIYPIVDVRLEEFLIGK